MFRHLALALAFLPLVAQGSGTFPASPFNGMQITYAISGAEVTGAEDREGFTTSRSLKGRLGSGTLRVSGSAKMGNGFGARLTVTVRAGEKSDSFSAYIKSGFPGFNTQAFDVSVPIGAIAANGEVSVRMVGEYNAGTRGLVVGAAFSMMGRPADTAAPEPPPPPSATARWKQLQDRFQRDLPRGKVGSGKLNNVLSLWDSSYKEFACGGYQAKTLAWLDGLRNSKDPAERALVEGYDYGPIEAYYGGHQAVAIWPKGTTWTETATVLDPWPDQRPTSYPMAQWAMTFAAGSFHGIRGSSVYQDYPTCGGTYPPQGSPRTTPQEQAWFQTLPSWQKERARQLPPDRFSHWLKQAHAQRAQTATLQAHCPVEVVFGDAEGRLSGFVNGKLVAQIPEVSVFRQRAGDGTWWYEFRFPAENRFGLKVIGTGSGTAAVYSATGLDRTPERRTVERYDLRVKAGEAYTLARPGSAGPLTRGAEAVLPVRATIRDGERLR